MTDEKELITNTNTDIDEWWKPANLSYAGDTEEQLLAWFHDNGWLRAIHSENILRNERYFACLFIHPSGIWANGGGNSELIALREANRQAIRRWYKLKQLTKQEEPKL
jgi:hypothetical protein